MKFRDILNEISVEGKEKYEWTHGKKPRGNGTWMFDIDGKQFEHKGTYSEAEKAAKAEAKKTNAKRVKILT
jgi:hypothetical protein